MHSSIALLATAAGFAAAQSATTQPLSPVSNVKGVVFDRFFQIWLENTDYSTAAANTDQKWLASQGIQLTNYWSVGHTSEPNYCAAAGGDLFGMDNDNLHNIPANVSSVADLLDTKGISWAEYQEAMPYPGYEGYSYNNPKTNANDYVRKHNPMILYDSVTNNATRLRMIKNFTNFEEDLNNNVLPQWAFFTPNMTDDGHDTNVAHASTWERNWLTPLMSNSEFWDNTLILLTFDEAAEYSIQNKVFSVLLGGAVPASLKGTTDNTFYTHYSSIASVSANWGLPSLGRWDCGANIFEVVASKTGYTNYQVDTQNLYLNRSLNGPLSAGWYSTYNPNWPVPATTQTCSAGNGVLSSVVSTWGSLSPTYDYTAPFPFDASIGLSTGVAYSKNSVTYVSGVNGTM